MDLHLLLPDDVEKQSRGSELRRAPDSLTAMTGMAAEAYSAVPTLELRPLVDSYSGIRYEGLAPGTHLGLPSRHLTIAVSLGCPLSVAAPGRSSMPRPYRALTAGLHTRPASVVHDGSQQSVSVELTPLGARCLLGVPAAELFGTVAELEDLLGNDARELIDRLATPPTGMPASPSSTTSWAGSAVAGTCSKGPWNVPGTASSTAAASFVSAIWHATPATAGGN